MIALFNLQGYVLQLLPMAATVTLRAPLRIKYRDIMKLVSRSRYRSARREAINQGARLSHRNISSTPRRLRRGVTSRSTLATSFTTRVMWTMMRSFRYLCGRNLRNIPVNGGSIDESARRRDCASKDDGSGGCHHYEQYPQAVCNTLTVRTLGR